MPSTETKDDDLALVLSFTRPVGDGGQVHLQTTVRQSIDQKAMANLVDSLHFAGRRFSLHAALEKCESDLDHTDVAETQSMMELRALEERNKGKQQWLTEDNNKKASINQNLVAAELIRPKLNKKIASLHKELKGE